MKKRYSFTRTKHVEPHLLPQTYAYKGWGPRGEEGTPCCQGLYPICKCDNNCPLPPPRYNWNRYDSEPLPTKRNET